MPRAIGKLMTSSLSSKYLLLTTRLIARGYKTVGYVSKQYTSGTDTYMVEINGGEDVLLFLCASVVLDKIFHE